ncbi:hypothetical protein [Bacillus coahuilensis]|nr:hypothetical protein [Bacillus coahuilensis]
MVQTKTNSIPKIVEKLKNIGVKVELSIPRSKLSEYLHTKPYQNQSHLY